MEHAKHLLMFDSLLDFQKGEKEKYGTYFCRNYKIFLVFVNFDSTCGFPISLYNWILDLSQKAEKGIV